LRETSKSIDTGDKAREDHRSFTLYIYCCSLDKHLNDVVENNKKSIISDFLIYSLITILFCSFSFAKGYIGGITALFTIAPPTLFYINHKRLGISFFMIIVVAAAIFAFVGKKGCFYYTYEFGVLNTFLFLALKEESGFVKIVFKSSLFASIAIFFVLGSLAVLYKVNVHEVIVGFIDTQIGELMRMYEKVDLTTEQLEQVSIIYDNIMQLFKKIYPALLFVGFEVIVTVNLYAINRFFLKDERKIDTHKLLKWTPNENLVWGLIFFGFLYFIKNDYTSFVALNGLIIFMAVYFFSGLCIVNHFFKTRKIPIFVQGMIYFIIILMNELKFVLVILGVLNIWFDFRKIKKKTV
jgi:hypothetical protein